MEYISHIREWDEKEQTVSEHCNNVAKIASEFGQVIQMPHTAWLQGILHDAGKLCNDFTEYIHGEVMHKEAKLTIVIWEQNIFLLYHKSCAKRMPFLWMLLF